MENNNDEALPEPSDEAKQHSALLIELIKAEIAAQNGSISFAQYMALALHAPGLGYYSAGSSKFGDAGDFVTAPEISSLFSQCIARQCQQVIVDIDHAEILEVGAGSGVMGCDILLELERLECLPEKYSILEISADLRERQQKLFEQCIPHLLNRVQWLDQLPAKGFSGVVLANELLDAMPVHRFNIEQQSVSELHIKISDSGDAFEWCQSELSDPRLSARLEAIRGLLPEESQQQGYVSEINLAAEDWLRSIAQMMQQGLLLIIDYGFPVHEFYHPQRDEGTLMCHYRHRAHDDALILAGLQDITAHVDFTALAEAAHDSGMSVSGYTNQAQFLLATGITGAMAGLNEEDDLQRQIEIAQQIKKLTLPHEMGELFKVLALTKNLEQILVEKPLLGFSLQDLRRKL